MADERFELAEITSEQPEGGLDYLRFTVPDLHGIGRTLTVPKRHIQRSIENNGVSMFSGLMSVGPRSNLTLVNELDNLHLPNCNVAPQPRTFHMVPWAAGGKRKDEKGQECTKKYSVGEVICESFWIKPYQDGGHMNACTRYVARKQLDHLKELGFVLKSAFEAEFTVFDSNTLEPVFPGLDASTTLILSKFEEYLYDMEQMLKENKVDLSSIVVEHGAGQFEFAMEPVDGIEGADAMFLIKQGIKEMTHHKGWTATFMARPFPKSSTNGLHFNHSVWSYDEATGTKRNEFYDAGKPDGLSDMHRHWIAGLLKHSKAMTALCCPTVNCYRRLHCLLAPHKVDWGLDDRLATYRAKSQGHSATYLENRLPSGSCNPYLVLACTVAAGIDGIVNQLECPEPRHEGLGELLDFLDGQFPRKEDSAEETYFPYSLEESIDCLQTDGVLREALGEDFVRWFVQAKRKNEISVMKNLPNYGDARFSKERDLYLDFL